MLSQLFGNLTNGSSSGSSNSQSQSYNSGSSNRPININVADATSTNHITNAILREAFSLMDSDHSNSNFNTNQQQRLNQPLGEFIRLFGADLEDLDTSTSPTEQSSLNLFNVFFQSMSLGDMINLARGEQRDAIFERTRQPLRDYLANTYSLTNSNDDPLQLDEFVVRLYNDLFVDVNGLQVDFGQFTLLDSKCDYPKSFETLMRHHLRALLVHILADATTDTSSTSVSWSSGLFDRFQSTLDQLVNLNRVCLANADDELVRFAVRKLNSSASFQSFLQPGGIVSGQQPFFNIFEGFVRAKLQGLLAAIPSDRDAIQQFIVMKETHPKEESQLVATCLIADEDNQSLDQYDSASSTLSGHSMEIDQHFAIATEQQQASKREPSSNQRSELIDATWINSVPSEWVETICKDVAKQQHQQDDQEKLNQQQQQHSDAYINGMPSKRRRILATNSADMMQQMQGPALFRKVLARTIEQMKLKLNVRREDVLESNRWSDPGLLGHFQDYFENVIGDRLRQDEDFARLSGSQAGKEKKDNKDQGEDDEQDQQKRFKFIRKRFK